MAPEPRTSDLATSRRLLVPSEREVTLGAELPAVEFASPTRAASRRSIRGMLRDYARDLNPKRLEGPKLPLVLLGLSTLFTQWDEVALPVILPEMRAEFAFSLQFLVTLGAVITSISIILAPLMGFLADRIKRIWMLRIGGLLAGVGWIVQALAPGVPQLVGGRSIAGAGDGIVRPAGFPLITDYYPLHVRARAFVFVAFMGGLGAIAGPTIAGNLAEWFGWRVSIGSLGVLALLVGVSFFLLKEPIRGYQDRILMGANEEEARREQEPVSWSEAWRSARSITTLRRLWYATPFLQVAWTGILIFLNLYYAEEFGLDPTARGYLATATGVFALGGLVFAGPIADRLLTQKPGRVMVLLALVLVVYAGSILVLVVSPNLWLSILVGLPFGFGLITLRPALYTLISLVIPARIRGFGLQTIAPWQLLGLLFLPFIGFAADSWGLRLGLLSFVPIWLTGAAILGTSGFGVERDMRAAAAASMAEEEARRARERGQTKMIICRDLDVIYDGVQVLFHVDFDVEEGEIVALVGTNGAGKSTLLRAIAGVQEAANGAIFLDGQEITHVPPHENAARGLVMAPGGQAIFPTLTVGENLRAAAWLYREEEQYVREGTEKVLGYFPILRERLQQVSGTLSGGEQQMLALGQTLLMRPRLLMIDELSLGLAPTVVEKLLDTLRAIHAQGTTIILVEQSLNVALTLADRAVFMEKGEVRYSGPSSELLSRPDIVRSVFMGGAASGRLIPRSRRTRPASREALLQVEEVSVSYGGVHALRGAALEVSAGEVVGIIGPNGAGKTTLFDVISGFTIPDTGKVKIGPVDATHMGPDARAKLGLSRSFQNVRLFASLTVRENIAVALERHLQARSAALAAVWAPKLRRAERRAFRRVDSYIELLGLDAYADKFVNELSTGTRRAVDIACIMASDPKVLLLDEPSSGLAQAEAEDLAPVLLRLSRETFAAMLVIEHDLPLISSISSRLIAMDLGAVIASGEPDEVLSDPQVVTSYLAAAPEVVARSGQGFAALVKRQQANLRQAFDNERVR